MSTLTVVKVARPTSKGTVPFTCLLEGHGLMNGWAKAGVAVAVGDVLDLDTIAYDRETRTYWSYLQ